MIMLDPTEAAAVAAQFGVGDLEVRRDHLMSHLLGALAGNLAEEVVFLGGTALARSHLPNGRLSEDLDLVARGKRASVASVIERVLATGARRDYGRLSWQPRLSAGSDVDSAMLVAADGLAIRVQLLDETRVPQWPTEHRQLLQRYSDAPPTRLRVPTLASFVALKTAAWADRRQPRDLYDLWGLAGIGAIDETARDLYVTFGPSGEPPDRSLFEEPPDDDSWKDQLGGQTRLLVGALEAASRVRDAWGLLLA
jgi:predicted nucleotidyltransferase component of viral defense system